MNSEKWVLFERGVAAGEGGGVGEGLGGVGTGRGSFNYALVLPSRGFCVLGPTGSEVPESLSLPPSPPPLFAFLGTPSKVPGVRCRTFGKTPTPTYSLPPPPPPLLRHRLPFLGTPSRI